MRRPDLKTIFTSYAVAWVYLAGFIVAQVIYAALSPHDQASYLAWASTSVHNLHRDPVGSLVASAFVTQESPIAWPALIALALFGANGVLGNWRTVVVCAAGQVIGTLVSEGIIGYRVDHGLLPPADRYLIDVGPSYVVVSAIMVALLYGSWLARAAAALDLALLVFVGDIFAGLSNLDVAAVGHVTAMTVGAVGGSLLVWQRRRRQQRRGRALGEDPAGASAS
jgi:membrane associated rhomboid family serine protease